MENRNYTPIYRIMHWAIALCVSLILVTIFLRLTWLNKESVSQIIQDYFSGINKSISQEESIALARKIRKPMWEWHIYLGYVLVGLYSLRMILPLFGEMKFSNPMRKALSLKVKFQFWVYIIFYVCMATSLTTGMFMEFGPKSLKDIMESVHVLSIYYIVAFMILHLGGVLLAEMTNQKGIISMIVSGVKDKKN